jgi:hypothetical protein
MTRLEKIQMIIDKGYTCDVETGKVYGVKGNEINTKHREGYIKITFVHNTKFYELLAHHFIFYKKYNMVVEQIDHINRDRSDNRIKNLRSVTNQENQFNRKSVKGYCWDKTNNKWMSKIKKNGKTINLGRFNTEEEAKEAYLEAKKVYHIIKKNV